MTQRLSSAFFGNKKFKQVHFYKQELTDQDILTVFVPYSQKLASIQDQSQQITLLSIFAQFIRGNLNFARLNHFSFEKTSTWLQISAEVFEHSFQKWLTKEQSYSYFAQILVRHSLFRPPHSVNVFQYDNVKSISEYWTDCFHRYYEDYKQCMMSQLQECLICEAPQKDNLMLTNQRQLFKGKVIEKGNLPQILNNIISNN